MRKLWHLITSNLYRQHTLADLMARELADAELQLLAAESAREFADSSVMLNRARIERLRARLGLA